MPGTNQQIERALDKIARLTELKKALAVFSDFEIAMVLRLPYGKRDLAIHRINRAIEECKRTILWAEETQKTRAKYATQP